MSVPKNAKVAYFAVLTGSLRREDLEKLGVKNTVNSVIELPVLVRKPRVQERKQT